MNRLKQYLDLIYLKLIFMLRIIYNKFCNIGD